MKHLVITGDRDRENHDFTGAFEPESVRYAAHWRAQGDAVDVTRVDLSQRDSGRVAQMVTALKVAGPVDRLALFCHGWREGIQLGLSIASRAELDELAAFATALASTSTPDLRIALYCCSTGASDGAAGAGSFADRLRLALVAAGRPDATVFSHRTAGHTTRNAAVRLFGPRMVGGLDLGTTPDGRRRLNAQLHDPHNSLRWTLPYTEPSEAVAQYP